MFKRIVALFLTFAILIVTPCFSFACDEKQSSGFILQILFGDDAYSYESNESVKMLMNALYLCSEQCNEQGKDKYSSLRGKGVYLPSFSSINISEGDLLNCSHNAWEHVWPLDEEAQGNRKKVLQRTVNRVFDFGPFNNWFGSSSGKCDSFAAMLYYLHILSDYLADDPEKTKVVVGGRELSGYGGQAVVTINGDMPSFTLAEKNRTQEGIEYSSLDSLGRCGSAFALLSYNAVFSVGERMNIDSIIPSGWNQKQYDSMINAGKLYNRSHLIAHSLSGADNANNLIAGTRYLNESGMKPLEELVRNYIKVTGNHVLYRVTPIFDGDNLIASGVQLEAYSVEDRGQLICFNRYCYNVQPGISINYKNGESSVSDCLVNADGVIPLLTYNPSDNNPDLIYELSKHFGILFEDQKSSSTYTSMISDITSMANEARSIGSRGEKTAQIYLKQKEFAYKYMETLRNYIPLLLQKEKFFKSAFNNNLANAA